MTKEETKTAKEEEEKKEEEKKETPPPPPPTPPLIAASLRLERLLGGDNAALDFYSNPVKVVRRWLGTSSGAAGKAGKSDICAAGRALLDPAENGPFLELLLAHDAAMETDEPSSSDGTAATAAPVAPPYLRAAAREVQIWLISLLVRVLYQEKDYAASYKLCTEGIQLAEEHVRVVSLTVTAGTSSSVGSLFPLLGRLVRYQSLVAESMQDASLRIKMTEAHNRASLRRDVDTQATALNCLLRGLLQNSQVEQAQKLLSNSTFPETASNNQLCRYLYYSGRIQAFRLEYTQSFSNLSQCLRKAPTNAGLGFRITAQRLLLVVQLLMGDIPERRVFFTKGMKKELEPYLEITQAVRAGDLAVYNQVVSSHKDRLVADGTYTLISRLAHQVVKAGLRKLHVSYSRLSLQDVADRLGLASAEQAEYVVAKAVRDGVLDATIHHEEQYVQSHELVDVYATKEPAEAFHRRIAYCLTVHNDAVRGMRYPPDLYKRQLAAARGHRRNKKKSDEEKAKELEDEFEDEY